MPKGFYEKVIRTIADHYATPYYVEAAELGKRKKAGEDVSKEYDALIQQHDKDLYGKKGAIAQHIRQTVGEVLQHGEDTPEEQKRKIKNVIKTKYKHTLARLKKTHTEAQVEGAEVRKDVGYSDIKDPAHVMHRINFLTKSVPGVTKNAFVSKGEVTKRGRVFLSLVKKFKLVPGIKGDSGLDLFTIKDHMKKEHAELKDVKVAVRTTEPGVERLRPQLGAHLKADSKLRQRIFDFNRLQEAVLLVRGVKQDGLARVAGLKTVDELAAKAEKKRIGKKSAPKSKPKAKSTPKKRKKR